MKKTPQSTESPPARHDHRRELLDKVSEELLLASGDLAARARASFHNRTAVALLGAAGDAYRAALGR